MDLARTAAVLDRGLREGVHIGAQLAVVHAGEYATLTLGEAARGVPMDDDTMMLWFSMSKPICALAVAQQWERGNLRIDEPIASYLPSFGVHGKERVTIRHLLTHTAGLVWADGLADGLPWRETVAENRARVYAAPLDEGWVPGEKAGYHPTSGMTVLGAVVEALDGRAYDVYVREEIFGPLGMNNCWVGMPTDRFDEYGDRIGVMHRTSGQGDPTPVGLDRAEVAALPIPGANGRGPMRELLRFYEMLCDEGVGGPDQVRMLTPQTVAAITARHRVGMWDHTFGAPIDWGLGFVIDNYAMGRHCSPRTFGHGGAQSSVAYCDPANDVVVAVVCNGMPGPEAHHPRMDAISTALYEDLALARGEGREKPYPSTGL
jgi:CubicO group peptidase (beta-lactamase class C family)